MSYTYKAFGPSDSTAAFLAGASVAERSQQLRAQEAEHRMRERHLAANAEMLAARAQEHYADIEQKKRAQVEYEAIKAASTEMFTEALKATGSADKAAAETYATLGVQYPSHAKDFAQAYADIKRGATTGETTPHQKAIEQLDTAKLGVAKESLKLRQDQEKRLVNREDRLATRLTEAQRSSARSLEKEIDDLNKQRNALDPEVAGNKVKRFKLATQAGTLKKQLEGLRGAGAKGAGKPSTESPKLPAVPQGRVLVRDKEGRMFHVPASQLEDAIDQGYEAVEEAVDDTAVDETLLQEAE